MEEKIFVCKCCGYYPRVYHYSPTDGYYNDWLWQIECRECGIRVAHEEKERTVEVWNSIMCEGIE